MTDDVCVLIPTLNEGETIQKTIEGLKDEGYGNILVMDGGSTDDTVEIAEDCGARVRTQSRHGKGQAVREAVNEHIHADVVLMLDGDGTYQPEDADAVVAPVLNSEADHVIGNRFVDMREGAMPRLNRVGNRLFNSLFAIVHGSNQRDILSGYRAFTMDAWRQMKMGKLDHAIWGPSNGFGVETELSVEADRKGLRTRVVPVAYLPRPDGSEPNLRPVRDGLAIVASIVLFAKMNRPLLYFGAFGTVSIAVGLSLSAYIAVEWFTRHLGHEVLAVVTAFLLLFGTQMFVFGALADLVVRLHEEQHDRIDRLEDDLEDDR